MTESGELPAAPRWHRAALAVLLAVFVVRGLFWAGTTQLFSPIDELQHADYVAALAEGDGVPIVGDARIRPELLRVAKFAQSSGIRIAPLRPTASDDRWGLTAESYEAFQGPLYYGLVAPAWKVGDRYGTESAIYTARAASVVLTALSLLVAYALARRLFPRHREVWLAAPAVLALAMGLAANPSALSNDALVIPLAGASLLPVAAAIGLRRPLTRRDGVISGVLVGLCVISKSNCVALAPLVALGVCAAAWLNGRRWRSGVEFLAAAAITGAVTLAPWIAWNLHAYGALSAHDAVDAITGPLQPNLAFGFRAVRFHLGQAVYGFWDMQPTAPAKNPATLLLFVACAVLGVVAMIRRRHHRREAVALGLTAAAFPLTFLTMLAVIFITFGGRSSVTGRHMYPALVAVAVLLAAGAVMALGRRAGLVALAALAVVSLSNDIEATDRYVYAAYETLLLDDLAPARPLAPGDDVVHGGEATVFPPCRASAVGIVAASESPAELSVTVGGVTAPAPRIIDLVQRNVGSVALYRLPAPTREPVTITADDTVALVSGRGRPLAEAWCAQDDAPATRFAQTFTPDHPKLLTRAVVLAWPRVWFSLSWVLLAVSIAAALWERVRARR